MMSCETPSSCGRSVAATVYCAIRSTAAIAASSVIGTQLLALLPSNTSECLAPPVPTRRTLSCFAASCPTYKESPLVATMS